MLQLNRLIGRDIIVVGQQPWDVSIGSNCKNIAMEWSKRNRVLYVNAALDRRSLIQHKTDPKIQKRISIIEGKEKGLVAIKENLWNLYPDCIIESINWIPFQFLFELFNKSNNHRFAKSIQTAITELGFVDVILFNDNDIFRSFHLKELLKPAVSVYYSRDFMLAVDYWKKHGYKLEPALIAKSDVCVANSTYLANYCKKFNPNSYYVGQGCELEIFMQSDLMSLPAEMKDIPNPVIGYVGALQSIRLDLNALLYIAEARPEWSLVLVGPEDDQFKDSILHLRKNVFFLGSKDPLVLPAYIKYFNVCINPQIVSQVTIGNYPRKIDEYLAVGKPIVATRTEAMEIFSKFCYLAETKEAYITSIEEALQTDSLELIEERKRFAATHTWENSVTEIDRAILNFINQHSKHS